MTRTKRAALAVLFFCLLAVTASAGLSIRQAANDQARHLEAQGFTLPNHRVQVFDFRWSHGLTIYSSDPVQYTILLLPWYWRDGLARAVIAHEYGHILLRQADLPGDPEEMADRVAACFGSAEAQDWMRRFRDVDPPAEECAELKARLIEGG